MKMLFTDYQKELINQIINGDLSDLNSFFSTKCQDKRFYLQVNFEDMNYSSENNLLPINKNELYYQLGEFIALWDKLEKANLIKILPKDTIIDRIKFICVERSPGQFTTDWTFIPIIYEYMDKQIFSLPELQTFVNNDYKTDEDIQKENELRNMNESLNISKNAQRTTKIIAIISIIVSVVTFLVNFYFYSTNRTVNISNPNAFNDTTHVIILSKPSVNSDTIKNIK